MTNLRDYTTMMCDPTRWLRLRHRPGDVVISTAPKSGTTVMQQMAAMLVHDTTDLPAPLGELSPWVDMRLSPESEVFAQLDEQPYRRVIKTHTPLDGLPLRPDVTYVVVVRDPRDCLVSMGYHMGNVDMNVVMGRLLADGVDLSGGMPPGMITGPPRTHEERETQFLTFVTATTHNENPSLVSVVHHARDAWHKAAALDNVHLFHYVDLQCDLAGQLENLARVLSTGQSPQRCQELARAATLDAMRANAERAVPEGPEIYHDPEVFFRTGARGEWLTWGLRRELMDAYQARVAQLVDDDLARWIHREGLPRQSIG